MRIRSVLALAGLCLVLPARAGVVADWNATALIEVRSANQGPPVTARALAVAHTCIYDAWSVYDALAVPTIAGTPRRPSIERTDANRTKALSCAAYRCLANLYPSSAAALRLAAAMGQLGFDPNDVSTNPATPQGIGNLAAARVISARANDGANQIGALNGGAAYSDYTGYQPVNPLLRSAGARRAIDRRLCR